MDNRFIASALMEMAKGLEFLDDNPFKVQAYRKAAHAVAQLDISVEKIIEHGGLSNVPSIGKNIASKIEAWVRDHDFSDLEEIRSRLPQGLDELLKVPGLGLKRVRILHRERSIETVEDLIDAVAQGKLKGLRAFPAKFVNNLPTALERVIGYRGKYTLDLALAHAEEVRSRLASKGVTVHLTGKCRRSAEVLERIEFLVEGDQDDLENVARILSGSHLEYWGNSLVMPSLSGLPPVEFKVCSSDSLAVRLFLTTGSDVHIRELKRYASGIGIEIDERGVFSGSKAVTIRDEEDIYRTVHLQYLPPEVREGRESEMDRARGHSVPALIRTEDIRGTIHNHTTYSDGKSALRDMVFAARDRGLGWIGISDHSRSAYYAGGMNIEDIVRQHEEIDELMKELEGFTILKGIESDILGDGSLDYPPEILETFDFVVASIHTGMEMDRKSMTERIITALKNPYTTILAHPTGRLLLAREPYEVDMDAVLETALAHNVVVELNANPLRLDIDWRLIDSFVTRGGVIAISPDAHVVEGLDDIEYGIRIARKSFLTPEACLNAWDIEEVMRFMRRS